MKEKHVPPLSADGPIANEEIRPASLLSSGRLFLLAGLGLAALLFLIGITRPALVHSAMGNLEGALQPKAAPLPASLGKAGTTHTTATVTEQQDAFERLQQQTSASADPQVERFWTEFEKSAWGVPLHDWSSQHPDIPCESFRGRAWGLEADRQWSHRCSAGRGPEAAHWSFYVFGLQEPLVARLEQFDVSTVTLPEEALGNIQNLLQNRIAARFGAGEDRSGPKAILTHQVAWPRNWRWQTPEVEIQLDLVEFDPQRKEGRLRLQGRHGALLEALKEDSRLQFVATSGYSYEYYRTGSGIDAQLADQLRPDFPGVATMLMKDQPDPDPQTLANLQQKQREAFQAQIEKQRQAALAAGRTGPVAVFAVAVPQAQTKWKAEEFYGALLRLLESSKTSAPDRQPAMLWAADRLAERLPSVIANDKPPNADWSEWRTQLAAFDVTYGPSADEDGPLAYTGSLLKRVWTDYGQSEWGERAFLVLQSHGWDMAPSCEGGSDQFRAVIPQGLSFLEQHSKSPYQSEVLLTVAQAYETGWSLSQAQATGREDDWETVDPQKYQEGSEAARQRAIASYERLLQTAPQSDQAAYARRVLPRLKLGIDTGQRRFYCVYQD
jgi:hypothetical protein